MADIGRMTLAKAAVPGIENPFAVFDEWNAEADRNGYADL